MWLNRRYRNRSVWSTHKGRALAHKALEARGTKQCTLVSLAWLWPLTITHRLPTFTPSRETIQLRKTAAELLTVRSVWEAVTCWQDKPLCAFLSFSLSSLSLSLSFWKSASTTAATRCVAEDDWIYPVVGVHCGPGAAVGSFSGWKSPFTHPVNPRVVSSLFTWRSSFSCSFHTRCRKRSWMKRRVKVEVEQLQRVRWEDGYHWRLCDKYKASWLAQLSMEAGNGKWTVFISRFSSLKCFFTQVCVHLFTHELYPFTHHRHGIGSSLGSVSCRHAGDRTANLLISLRRLSHKTAHTSLHTTLITTTDVRLCARMDVVRSKRGPAEASYDSLLSSHSRE